jgi:hypothetical protein
MYMYDVIITICYFSFIFMELDIFVIIFPNKNNILYRYFILSNKNIYITFSVHDAFLE